MQLLQDIFIIEQLQVLSEGKANGPMKIRGVFGRCNEKNNNGRIYPTAVLESQLSKVQPLINERRLCGELDHPQNDTVKLSNASHLITKLDMKGNELIGEAEILKTPAGLTAKALVEGGVKIGISSRGMGTLSENETGDKIVNEDFRLVTFDLVADPSTRGAFPGLSESTESKFVQESQTKLQKEGNFVTMLESKMRDAYDPWIEEAKKKSKKELDPVGQEDADVNNDGAVNSTDSYLKNRRKVVGKAIKEEGSWHQIAYAVADALGHDVKKKVDEGFDDEVKKSKAKKGQRAEVRTSRAARISALRSKAVERKAKKTAKKEAKKDKKDAKESATTQKNIVKGKAQERRDTSKPDTGQRRRGEDKTFGRRKRGPATVDKATQAARKKQMTSHPNFEKAISNLQKDVNEAFQQPGEGDTQTRSGQIQRGAGTPAAGYLARRRMIKTGKAQGQADVAAEKARMKGQARLDRDSERMAAAKAAGKPVRVSATRRALGGVKDAAVATGDAVGRARASARDSRSIRDKRRQSTSNIETRNRTRVMGNLAAAEKNFNQQKNKFSNITSLPSQKGAGGVKITPKQIPNQGVLTNKEARRRALNMSKTYHQLGSIIAEMLK